MIFEYQAVMLYQILSVDYLADNLDHMLMH